jgi:hypothetical protein
VTTGALANTLVTAREHVGKASTRTETIIKTVDRIITRTDPATAAELQGVKQELFKVSAELRETQDAFITAEKQRIEAQMGADALRSVADANAAGWKRAEAEELKQHAEASLQRRLAWKWRGYAIGTWAIAAGLLVLTGYLKFLKPI